MSKYDIIIIGSGLGGLECGAILSKEGFNVCVVEKNAQFGGCFQTYQRKGHLLDTGIHYVGSLDEGQVMNQYFRYFGIMDIRQSSGSTLLQRALGNVRRNQLERKQAPVSGNNSHQLPESERSQRNHQRFGTDYERRSCPVRRKLYEWKLFTPIHRRI